MSALHDEDDPENCEDADMHFAYAVFYGDSGLRLCGCGDADGTLELALDMLRACPWYNGAWEIFEQRLTRAGFEFIAHQLTEAGLIEHGGTVGGSWITDKGRRFLAVMDGKTTDAFDETGYSGTCCPRKASA